MLPCQRHLFSLPEGMHYLNCAAQSPLPDAVAIAAYRALGRKVNPTLGSPAENYGPVEKLREQVGKLVNAPPDWVAFTPAVSYGVAIAVANTPLYTGQNVVLPGEEFPSNVYGWMDACARARAELRLVARPEDTQRPAAAWSERILEAIDGNTAVVSVTPLHWTDGTWFDLQAIGARAREVGAAFLVDGSQAIGAVPVDFQAVQPDLLLCTGYKWCLGPKAAGFLVAGERYLEADPIERNWITREGSEAIGQAAGYAEGFRPGARRFDAGEQTNPVAVSMLTTALEQILVWGVENVRDYITTLSAQAAEALRDSGYAMAAPEQRAPHLFGIRSSEPSHLPRLNEALKQRNVHVSLRGTAIRVSPHVFNTAEDIAALTEVLLDNRP